VSERHRARDEILRRIARLAEARKRVRSRDLPSRLYRQILREFGGLPEALRAAGCVRAPRSRYWSRERVILELRKVSRRAARVSARGLAGIGRGDLVSAAQRYVGGLTRARRLAGLPDPSPLHATRPVPRDADDVLREICRRGARGQSLALSKAPPALVMAARRRFGSWAKAIEAAGLDYPSVRLVRAPYTRGDLLGEFGALARRRPDLTLKDVRRKPYNRWAAQVRRFFGSFENAGRLAGLDDWPRRSRAERLLDQNAIIQRLHQRASEGRPIYAQAVARDDSHLWQSVRRHYRSWQRALDAARLANDSPARERWTRERVLERLMARRRAGASLAPTALRRDANPIYLAARRHFGSYRMAVTQILRSSPGRAAPRSLIGSATQRRRRGRPPRQRCRDSRRPTRA
jgi:hypothetical protein